MSGPRDVVMPDPVPNDDPPVGAYVHSEYARVSCPYCGEDQRGPKGKRLWKVSHLHDFAGVNQCQRCMGFFTIPEDVRGNVS